jgi:hypothetical protein
MTMGGFELPIAREYRTSVFRRHRFPFMNSQRVLYARTLIETRYPLISNG